MVRSFFLLLCSLSALLSLSAAVCPGGVAGSIVSGLAGYGPAQSWCSSKFPVPPVTSTVTTTKTITVTVSTATVASIATTTSTVTAPTTTITVTVSTFTATSTITTTDTITSTATATNTATQTATNTATQTTTTTVTVTTVGGGSNKRQVNRLANYRQPQTAQTKATTIASSTIKPPSYLPAYNSLLSQAASAAKSICSCIIKPSTTTVTTTSTTTLSVTATSTQSVTQTSTTTITPTTTSSVTASTTITVTTGTTSTVPTTTTTTTTITTTTTTTTTTAATATATVPPTFYGPSCNNPDGTPGGGGCSANCYCDPRIQGNGLGVCDTAVACGQDCLSDIDCPTGSACASGGDVSVCPNGRSCVSYVGCTSSFPSRKMLARSLGMEPDNRIGRMKRAPEQEQPQPGAIRIPRPDRPTN